MAITLKAARVNRNMTQSEAAEKLGISKDTLRNWEQGKSFPDVKAIKQIETLYGLSYNEISFLPSHSA